MYRRIILHAGLGKTGSTSIQETCFRNRDWLLQQGLHYPVFRNGEKHIFNHSDPITAALEIATESEGMIKRQALEREVAADPHAARNLFLSQLEQILDNPRADTLVLSGEVFSSFTKEEVEQLKVYFSARCEQLLVIAFLRSPISSFESILQQRIQGRFYSLDAVETNAGFVHAPLTRFQRLRPVFGDDVNWINYHEAITHPRGVVGSFFDALELSPECYGDIEFRDSNSRSSREAVLLMSEINRRLPPEAAAEHGVERHVQDLGPIATLPGTPFSLANLAEHEVFGKAQEDGQWLEAETGFVFPPWQPRSAGELWSTETLLLLEEAVLKLHHPKMVAVVADTLEAQAEKLADQAVGKSELLRFVAQRLRRAANRAIDPVLHSIGADYFKFAAMQIESVAPEMAMELSAVALYLRPDGQQIQESFAKYHAKLGKGRLTPYLAGVWERFKPD